MVTKRAIVINDRVEFATGKATIRPVSNSLLDAIATIFKQHPNIQLVEIQGHTDDRGAAATNMFLSRSRARAVRRALVKRGVSARRLTAKGYGESKPIAKNDTDAGRQQNRRVQFKILKRKKK